MKEIHIHDRSAKRGVSRREFMRFCAAMAAALALPVDRVNAIAEALEKKQKLHIVWLKAQDCGGDAASFLLASKPTAAEFLLDAISLDYHETLMASTGSIADTSLKNVVKGRQGRYVAIVEGAIPLNDGGVFCCVGGRTALDRVQDVCRNAAFTIAVGSCASWGGIASARPNPTGAVGLQKAVPGVSVVNLPGCPANVENLTATLVHYLSFGALPELDKENRPLFAYGKKIHDICERRVHFDSGKFVRTWGDDGHRKGWCLYEMGCKGPEEFLNCPSVKYNGGTSWPVQAGHGCIACAARDNWDSLSPFYPRPRSRTGAAVKIGAGVAVATAAGLAAHNIRRRTKKRKNNDGHE